MSWGTVELEPEVRNWLEGLPDDQFGRAAFYVDLLADEGVLLPDSVARHLGGKLWELRFHLGRRAVRITYWIAPGRRIILLTVFYKTRQREANQVKRAKRAMEACQSAQHNTTEEDQND
jgi:hypothetical protein